MRYLSWSVASVLVTAGIADADAFKFGFTRIQKVVTVEHTVSTDKDHPEYVFYLTSDGSPPAAVKFGAKQTISFKGTRVGKDRVLIAVPAAARKKYSTEEDYERAVGEFRAEGMIRANETLFSWIFVPIADTRDTVVREYKLVKIDTESGVVLEMKEVKPKDKDGGNKSPRDECKYAPLGGTGLAGLAAALGMSLGGFWLAGRATRRV